MILPKLASSDRKLPRSEQADSRFSNGRYRIVSVVPQASDLAYPWLQDPDVLFSPDAPWPEGSRSRSIRVHTEIGHLFVKQHRRTLWKRTCDTLANRASPALRGFRIGRALETSGVEAVRPLLALDRRVPGESFLFLEMLHGINLQEYLVTQLPESCGEDREHVKQTLWRKIGTAVADLHAAGVRQRDLKAKNLLVESTEAVHSEESLRIIFVDLEGMKLVGAPPRVPVRARDLARLGVSLLRPYAREAGVHDADWVAVLRCYLEAAGPMLTDAPPLDWWVRETLAWGEKKRERNRKADRLLM